MPAELAADAICFVWRDDRILARAAEPPTLPTLADVVRLGIDGVAPLSGPLPRHRLHRVPRRQRRARHRRLAMARIALAVPADARARARAGGPRRSRSSEWDRSHRFCGRCGAAMRDKPGERAKECPACGHVAYPRISPAMMVLVTRGRDLLLARANRFPGAMYSALAGFVEAGRVDRGLHSSRSARGSRHRGRRPALLRQPVVAVPALADDRLHRRIRGRRHASLRRRDRRCAMVLDRRAAAAALADQHFAQADRCDGRATAAGARPGGACCAAEAPQRALC